MRKLVSLGLLTLIMITSGCGAKEEVLTTCSLRATYMEGMDINATYKITSKGKYVTYVESIEELDIEDESVREEYYNTAQQQALPFENIKYYEANIEILNNTIRSVVSIDYEHINMNDLIKVNSGMKEYLKNGKITLDDMIKSYKEIGVVCK